MSNMELLADFLHSLTFEDNQFNKTHGYIPRFLDIKNKSHDQKNNIETYLAVGICRLFNVLEQTESLSHEKLLTYLFYDIILNLGPENFQSADESIINSECDSNYNIDVALFSIAYNLSGLWIRAHPEYYGQNPELYDSDEFPPKHGTITGTDVNHESYPIMTGELWYILDNDYGNKQSRFKPDLIIPVSKLSNFSFGSCWKVNHETSIDCIAASHRDSGVLMDFEAGISKTSPFNYNLISRNDLSCVGKANYKDWIMLLPENNIMVWEKLGARCGGVIDQVSARKIHKSLKRIQWFVKLLCFK